MAMEVLQDLVDELSQYVKEEKTRRFELFIKQIRHTVRAGDIVHLNKSVHISDRNRNQVPVAQMRIKFVYQKPPYDTVVALGQYRNYKDFIYLGLSNMKSVYRRGRLVLDLQKLRNEMGL